MFPVQFLTTDLPTYTHVQQVKDACEQGLKWIQYRTKNTPLEQWIDTAKEIRAITKAYNAVFIVNDNPEVAEKSDADGLHIGKEDAAISLCRKRFSNKILGYSCNHIDDVIYAQQEGASYAGIGPYRFTTTRQKLNPILGAELLKKIIVDYKQNHLKIPLVAIGGIELNDIESLCKIGIQHVALSSFIVKALLTHQYESITQVLDTFKKYNQHETKLS